MTSIYISWIEGSLSLMLVVTYDYQQVNGKNNDHLTLMFVVTYDSQLVID